MNFTKPTIEFIKQSFDKEGYQLLSKEYKNAHQYLDVICSNGHKYSTKYNNWQQGYRCRRCSCIYYNKVKEKFEFEGYTLLSTEYESAHIHLDYICPNNHRHKITWANFQQGYRCPKCSMNGISKAEKEILEYVKNNYNGTIKENDRTLIQNPKTGEYLELDIWLPDIRKAIEYNGEYYHSDEYSKWKDKIKRQYCRKNGIKLMVIYEKEWMQNKDFNGVSRFINERKIILRKGESNEKDIL